MRMSIHPSTSCLLLHCIVLLYSLCVCVCANDMPVQMKTNTHVEKVCVFKLRTKKNPCKLMTPSDSSKKNDLKH